MSELRSGITRILSSPYAYDAFQSLVGAYAWRRSVVERFIVGVLPANALVIDMGCGTSEVLKYLPTRANYLGFDRNSEYIRYARSRFRHRRAQFFCSELSAVLNRNSSHADVVLAFGLVHHLDDENSICLFKNANEMLKKNGFVLTLDPVYTTTQSNTARYIISKDRGTAVRSEADYKALACQSFDSVEAYIDPNPLRIPYTGIVMKCENRLDHWRPCRGLQCKETERGNL